MNRLLPKVLKYLNDEHIIMLIHIAKEYINFLRDEVSVGLGKEVIVEQDKSRSPLSFSFNFISTPIHTHTYIYICMNNFL